MPMHALAPFHSSHCAHIANRRDSAASRASLGSAASKGDQRDAAFVALLDAYRPTGGLLRGGELARLWLARGAGDLAELERSMCANETIAFEWEQTVWVPAFQLVRDDLGTRDAIRRVLAELTTAFDGWSTAHWFVAANPWLGEHAPIDLLGSDLDAVLDAARADRFVRT